MITRLIEVLGALDPPPTAEELADALWLAGRLRSYRDSAEPAVNVAYEPPTRDAPPEPTAPDRPRERTGGKTTQPSSHVSQAGLYLAGKDATTSFLIRSPAVPAIPRALRLARALRPLRVSASSPTRKHLDEVETAQHVAETGVWEPVMRPSPERRFDLALVVDTSSSMAVWRRTAEELQALLEQLGAFRDVRVWRLDTDSDPLLLRSGSTPGIGSGRSPDELIDPTRRRVVLIVSDCIGSAWQDGRAAALLERWGRSGPVAITQPLPQRLWRRCAAAVELVRFSASAPGLANDRLTVRSRADSTQTPPGVAIPVMELEPRWLGPWAAMVATGGREIAGAALFTGRPVGEAPPPDTEADDWSPLERVMRFRAASSPLAFKLAGYLAAAPLRLPVMRLVQQAMLPESTPGHLAEVFLSDLLRRADSGPDSGRYEVAYEFRDEVRDVLLAGLHRGEALRVLREVWGVVKDRLGFSLDFPALLGAIQRDESNLPPDQPFAQVAAQVLARLGGRYSEIAKRLAVTQAEHSTTQGRGAGSQIAQDPSARRRQVITQDEHTQAHPVLWGDVPPRNPDFTGRDDLLLAIRNALGGAVTVLLPHPLHGYGGEGKSQLAVEYAYRHAHEYDLVWWIPAEQITLARSALAVLARRLGTPLSDGIKGTVDNVLHALRTGVPHARWLLIYDNARDPAEVVPLMPLAEGGPTQPLGTSVPSGNVLITSRDRRWKELATTIDVDVFKRPESISLLRRRVPRLSVTQADQLAGRVGDLPLAVEQAATWQAVTGGSVEEYLRLFAQRLEELPEEQPPANLPGQLAASLDLTFKRLREENPVAGLLLELWAFFGPEPVAGELLSAGGTADLPTELAQVMADDTLLRDAMQDISRFTLARFDRQALSLQVHRLVRTMLRTRLSAADHARVRRYVHAILAAATPAEQPRDETTWKRRAEITPHVVPSEIIDGDSTNTRLVALDQAQFLYVLGDFEGSRLLTQIALNRWRDRYGADDESALDAARLLANALRGLGDSRTAADLSEDVLNRMRRRFGSDHLSTLFAANSFGADLRFRGDFKQAYKLDTDTWRRMRQLYGGDHADTLLAANSVGIDLRLLGEFHEAYAVDLDAFRWLRRQSGQRHRDVFRATHNLARDLHGLGRYAEALRLQRGSLEQTHPVLGPDHAFVLHAKMSHAGTLRKSGAFADAEQLAAETFEAHVRRFGEEHPNTLAAKVCLAMACVAVGAAQRGRLLMGETLVSYHRVMGDDHPFVHACAADLSIALRALSDIQAALETDEAALAALHRSPLGPDHYYALCCAVGLANDLYLLGELEAAYDLSSRTRERFQVRHGPNHPYTLACAHNHEMICRALGRPVESTVETGTDPAAALKQVLGEHHHEITAAAKGELLDCDIELTPL